MLTNKGRIWSVCLVAACIFMFFFSGLTKAEGAEPRKPEYVIRMHHGLPVGHYLDKAHKLFAEKVADKSKGRVRIDIYPAAQLYNDVTAVQAVMSGAIECVWDYDHKFFTVCPAWGAIGMPGQGIGAGGDDLRKSVEAMHDAFYEGRGPGALLSEELEAIGIHLNHFIYWSMPMGMASKKTPVIKPEDLKGRKIRVTTQGEAKMFHSVGAQAVSLTGAELYEAMARGTINTGPFPIVHLEERKLKEIVDYAVFPVFPTACVGAVVFNLKYWNSLPKDVQQMIEEAGREADREIRGQLPDSEAIYRKQMEEAGKIKFIDLTPAQQKPWMDLWQKYGMLAVKDLGTDAIEMWNSCQDFKKELGIEPFPKIE